MTTYVPPDQRLELSSHTRHKTILSGTEFGMLTINSSPFRRSDQNGKVFYECKCSCGEITVIRANRLNTTQSCGCITKRDGPRICKTCGKSEEEVDFPKHSGSLLCSVHDALHNKPIRRKAHKKWHKLSESSPKRFLAYLIHGLRGRDPDCGVDAEYLLRLWNLQNGCCKISGLKMEHKRGSLYSVSADKIDPKKGYSVGNIQLVCLCMNLARREHPTEELFEFLERYYQLRINS